LFPTSEKKKKQLDPEKAKEKKKQNKKNPPARKKTLHFYVFFFVLVLLGLDATLGGVRSALHQSSGDCEGALKERHAERRGRERERAGWIRGETDREEVG
jgi:hypothetical protein